MSIDGPHRNGSRRPLTAVYEVEPYRSAWLVRRQGSLHELLCTSRGEAIARAEALRAGDADARVELRDPLG